MSLPTGANNGKTARLWQIAAVVVLGLGWELAGRRADSLLFPSATATLAALTRLITSRDFWYAFWLSNQAFLAGFALALVAGISCGLVLARWTRIDRWLDVYLDLLVVVPKTALMPLLIMVVGLGLLARSLVVFTFAFPIIAMTVRAGAREVDPALVGMARAFCASEAQIWRRVVMPAALPAVMTATRLGIAAAVSGMVSVELLLIAVGIGRLVLAFRADFDAASLYASVLVVMLEAVVLVRLAEAFERRFGAWSGTAMVE